MGKILRTRLGKQVTLLTTLCFFFFFLLSKISRLDQDRRSIPGQTFRNDKCIIATIYWAFKNWSHSVKCCFCIINNPHHSPMRCYSHDLIDEELWDTDQTFQGHVLVCSRFRIQTQFHPIPKPMLSLWAYGHSHKALWYSIIQLVVLLIFFSLAFRVSSGPIFPQF